MVKKIVMFCLVLILAVAILPGRTQSQGLSNLESRISRLETDNYQLRSQVIQLQSQLNELRGRSQYQTPRLSRPAPPATTRSNRRVLSSDPMFDRLATLVIELRERLIKLEAQVADLHRRTR